MQVQDKIGFLINNLSNSNLKQKASDVKEILTEQYWPWFCNYMVVKRAAQEQNFHLLYASLLQELQVGNLHHTAALLGGSVLPCDAVPALFTELQGWNSITALFSELQSP